MSVILATKNRHYMFTFVHIPYSFMLLLVVLWYISFELHSIIPLSRTLNICLIRICWLLSARHAGSKTLLPQHLPYLDWGCWLTQVDKN